MPVPRNKLLVENEAVAVTPLGAIFTFPGAMVMAPVPLTSVTEILPIPVSGILIVMVSVGLVRLFTIVRGEIKVAGAVADSHRGTPVAAYESVGKVAICKEAKIVL
jgi:lysylphosphatidylglycerol synthetase-like protein (DUF2156 family)